MIFLRFTRNREIQKQAGAEQCQSRVLLEVIVEVVVKVRIEAVIKIDSTTFAVGWVVGELESNN